MPYRKETAKKKWTVEMMKVYRKFCGWDTLKDIINAIDYDLRGPLNEVLIHNKKERDEARSLVATTFETGARICEVIGQQTHSHLGLMSNDIKPEGSQVRVIFNIAKRYRKIAPKIKFKAVDGSKLRWDDEEKAKKSERPYISYKGYITERKIFLRNITFPVREPLVYLVLDWWKRKRPKEKEINLKLFDIGYNKAYRIITSAGRSLKLDFPPHRLRAERATQLALEYGFDDGDLTEWFGWKSPVTAHEYTTLAEKTMEKMVEAEKIWEIR